MPSLQVLRLQHCQLRDSDMEILASAIGIRVRSLDIRGNQFTDASVRTLLQYCFTMCVGPDRSSDRSSRTRPRASSGVVIEDSADWPSGIARPDAAILDEFRDRSLNERFVRRLTTGIVTRLPSQDLQHAGLTHLHIAENHLSVEGVSSLIRASQLYVLDVASFDTSKVLNQPRGKSSSSPPTSGGHRIFLPGAEKLVPVLEDFGQRLTYLRLHHSVVTKAAPARDESIAPKAVELHGDSNRRQELDSIVRTFELSTDEPAPRYELPGDAVHVVVSPAVGQKPSQDGEDGIPTARRGSMLAPEAVEGAGERDELPLPIASAPGTNAQVTDGIYTYETRQDATFQVHNDTTSRADFQRQCDILRSQQIDKPHGLLPGMLPRLRTLVLTGVPCNDKSGIVNSLINFIRACASEAEIAELQANLESKHFNRPRVVRWEKVKRRARDIFSLQRIVLEMGPDFSSPSLGSNSLRTPLTPPHSFRTKSSTEDADSEALWHAQENDFSFFEDDEECGLPLKERLNFPLSTFTEKVVMPAPDDISGPLPTLQTPPSADGGSDVVQDLAKFRKERKAARENALNLGIRHIDGYWPGEINIVRWHARTKRSDFYGNVYEKGIYR